MTNHTRPTQAFIAAIAVAGLGSAVFAGSMDHAMHLPYAVALLVIAAVTSRLKVKLPGIDGNMSMNLPFLLMAVVNLSAVEAVVVAGVSTVVQTWPKRNGKFKPEQMLFNVSMLALATSIASLVWHSGVFTKTSALSDPVMLAAATVMFFFGQTAPVAAVISISEGGKMGPTWSSIAHLSFPYFVLSAGVAAITDLVGHFTGWPIALALVPVMYTTYRSYRTYFGMASATGATPLTRAAAIGR